MKMIRGNLILRSRFQVVRPNYSRSKKQNKFREKPELFFCGFLVIMEKENGSKRLVAASKPPLHRMFPEREEQVHGQRNKKRTAVCRRY